MTGTSESKWHSVDVWGASSHETVENNCFFGKSIQNTFLLTEDLSHFVSTSQTKSFV